MNEFYYLLKFYFTDFLLFVLTFLLHLDPLFVVYSLKDFLLFMGPFTYLKYRLIDFRMLSKFDHHVRARNFLLSWNYFL